MMDKPFPFLIADQFHSGSLADMVPRFQTALPFRHIVIDDFLPEEHARFLSDAFPKPDHPVWLDWRKRSAHQYGKQGPGNAARFHLLDPAFRLALQEFNASSFLQFLEQLTGIDKLLPDPHFTGGGMHQILRGGILDVHTDFNLYHQLQAYRQLNVLVYLNEQWRPGYGGELELWDASPNAGGACAKSIPPLFNRAVVFKTDKTSFHGHTREWSAPEPITRRSIALYYYTTRPLEDTAYDDVTDFQGVASKPLPDTQ